ncbi:hypothetical protein Fmac_014822 [Flemingia macrophylla]|uniref:Uncharacterized protein n=1 Tax=Flemingia macrophylla TaxID=520843 RepID=A0ABD1MCU7_9FABA
MEISAQAVLEMTLSGSGSFSPIVLLYAPTTLAPARDFWLLRYTSVLQDGSLVPWSVPEVLRPLYESSTCFGSKTTMVALRRLRQISHEVSRLMLLGWRRRPAALRALSRD